MPQDKTAKRYYVSGMVQGVGYRYFAQRVARRLGVIGYVMNLRDGRVQVYAAGSPESLGVFRRELERGPQGSSVSDIVEQEAAIEPHFADDFSIQYDG